MTYVVRLTTSARKELRRIDPQIRRQVAAVITNLAEDPRPDGVKKMAGREHVYRVSAARDWRVVYEIYDEIVTVDVIQIDHRGQVYKQRRH
ncbi:MAG: type II toxin-antitoxin system mRNA interferase toxin, RelE/StbE family [Acidimicrobiales bacterium]|nr:MAG: type II toxin-antitoxin system mRNA interferase toxin, RelE/StbE family [Acidimicrobiales bacterium]